MDNDEIEDGQLNEITDGENDDVVGDVRRGIRVNFNSVKEYLSLLTNFINGKKYLNF